MPHRLPPSAIPPLVQHLMPAMHDADSHAALSGVDALYLILQACSTEGIQAQIVRPSIVTPAWAAPYAGWSGDKPSTIVAAQLLLLKRCLRIFRCSSHPCPPVPVDIVACAAIQALVAHIAEERRVRGFKTQQ